MVEALRQYDHTINIEKPCLFLRNKNDNITKILNNTFLNTCWKGSFILKIIEVNKSSCLRIISTNNSAFGAMNICFTANVLNYSKNDIILGCSICIFENKYSATNDNISAALVKSEYNKILTKDMKIPLVVDNIVNYKSSCKSINLLANILLPILTTNVYQLNGILDKKTMNNTTKLISLIEEQENLINNPEVIKYSLLFSSIKNPKTKGGINIINFIKNNDKINMEGYWSIDLNYRSDLPIIIKTNETKNECINATLSVAFYDMLYQIFAFRAGMINMYNYYKDNTEEYDSLSIYLNIVKKHKIST